MKLKAAILFSVALIGICNGSDGVGEYDQLVLYQTHPVTAYWNLYESWPTNRRSAHRQLSNNTWSSLKSAILWGITAFWPSKYDGNHPTDCHTDNPQIDISPGLRSQLRTRWPIYSSIEFEEASWQDAWTTYGTCMTDLQSIDDASSYLNEAIVLSRIYNIGFLLWRNSKYPGSDHTLNEITSVIRSKIGIDAHLQCIEDENGLQYLLGGSVCFNKAEQVEECVSVDISTCNPDKQVYIPAIPT